MATKPRKESRAAAQRRLTEEIVRLDVSIDRPHQPGPARLELLRQQAALSDEREMLRSGRR